MRPVSCLLVYVGLLVAALAWALLGLGVLWLLTDGMGWVRTTLGGWGL